MGLFSSLASIESALNGAVSTKQSSEAIRKEHGFANFDADMERMRNQDLAVELENPEPLQPISEKSKPGNHR